MKHFALPVVLGCVLLAACNSYTAKEKTGEPLSQSLASSPDYATIHEQILKPYCVMCHNSGLASGGVSVDSYAATFRAINQIEDAVAVHQTMPPGQPLPGDLQQLMTNWVSNGAPETAAAAAAMPVTDYEFLMKSKWVIPGKPAASELFKSVESGAMPPGEPLSKDELETIRSWIADGAPND